MNSEPGERFEAAGGWLRTHPVSLWLMSRSVYIASPEGLSGKSSVALGLVDLLCRQVGKPPDRFRKRDHVFIAHIARQEAREIAVRARV